MIDIDDNVEFYNRTMIITGNLEVNPTESNGNQENNSVNDSASVDNSATVDDAVTVDDSATDDEASTVDDAAVVDDAATVDDSAIVDDSATVDDAAAVDDAATDISKYDFLFKFHACSLIIIRAFMFLPIINELNNNSHFICPRLIITLMNN